MIFSRHKLGFVPYLLIVFGFIGFFSLLKEPVTLSYIDARSEKIIITVTSPELMRQQAIYFTVKGETETPMLGARATVKPAPLLCQSGLIEPTQGTKVTYRKQDEKLTLSFEREDSQPAAIFKGFTNNIQDALSKASFLSFERGNCAEKDSLRLPVFGQVEIGDEQRVVSHAENSSSLPLLEGRIVIYGQTFEMPLLDNYPKLKAYFKKSLYFVQELEVPTGARVYETKSDRPKALWSGFANIDEEAGLDLQLTTNARTIALQLAGGQTEPFLVTISNIAQIINDPNILNLQLLGLAIVFLFQLFASLLPNKNKD